MRPKLRLFLDDEAGATVVEYAIILAVLSAAVLAGISQALTAVEFLWSNNESRLQQAFQ